MLSARYSHIRQAPLLHATLAPPCALTSFAGIAIQDGAQHLTLLLLHLCRTVACILAVLVVALAWRAPGTPAAHRGHHRGASARSSPAAAALLAELLHACSADGLKFFVFHFGYLLRRIQQL